MCNGKENCNCGCKTVAKSEREPIIIQLPILIKASMKNGKRFIDFEASCASKDYEGDVIEQKALLDSKDYFIREGFLDVDHYCELGRNPDYAWLNIKNPDSWIVGKPIEVYDLGDYRTGVKAEIKQSAHFDPINNKADWLWQQLKNEQGEWKASVYGYPGPDTEEGGCTMGTGGPVCASRYLVKSFRWHSTALTRNPINKSLKKTVQIITMKAFANLFAAKMGHVDLNSIPDLKPIPKGEYIFNRGEIRKSYFTHIALNCPETNNGEDINVYNIRGHFLKCVGMPFYLADAYALATRELIERIV